MLIYRLANPYHLDTQKIKHLQLDRKVSNADIARRLKISIASVTRHIQNQRHNQYVQEGIAKALKVQLADILARNGNGATLTSPKHSNSAHRAAKRGRNG